MYSSNTVMRKLSETFLSHGMYRTKFTFIYDAYDDVRTYDTYVPCMKDMTFQSLSTVRYIQSTGYTAQ